jgi:hypothetical protein
MSALVSARRDPVRRCAEPTENLGRLDVGWLALLIDEVTDESSGFTAVSHTEDGYVRLSAFSARSPRRR